MTTFDILGNDTKKFSDLLKNYTTVNDNEINCPSGALAAITSAMTNISRTVENIRTGLNDGKSIRLNFLIELRNDKSYFREVEKQINTAVDEESEKIKAILKEIDEL